MPAPSKAQLEPIVAGFLQAEGLRGRNAPDLAAAIAEAWAGALQQFVTQALVAPGIACSPGASTAPGRLI
jgi:hypothetical protein